MHAVQWLTSALTQPTMGLFLPPTAAPILRLSPPQYWQAGADECIDMAHHKPEQLKSLLRQSASQGGWIASRCPALLHCDRLLSGYCAWHLPPAAGSPNAWNASAPLRSWHAVSSTVAQARPPSWILWPARAPSRWAAHIALCNLPPLSLPAGVDVIFDPVGGSLLMESLKAARWGAHILIIGFASGAALRARQRRHMPARHAGLHCGRI